METTRVGHVAHGSTVMRLHALNEYMGQLLGPRPVAEIVITAYDDDKKTVNFQVEGMRGPLAPEYACNLLALVHQELAKHVTPVTLVTPVTSKETPVNE